MCRYDVDEDLFLSVVDRMWWGEIEPRKDEMTKATHPFARVRFAYDEMQRGDEPNLLDAMMRWEERLMKEQNQPDIPYNFMVGNWGIVYEGRGWDYEPLDTTTSKTIVICYIGDFSVANPDWNRMYAAHHLILYGMKENYIQKNHLTIPYKTGETVQPV